VANGVWHSGLQRIIELDKEDLGLGETGPSVSEVMESLLQPVAQRHRELLICVESSQGRQCKAEQSGVKSPHMYVRKHRSPDGALRLRAAHLPTVHEMTPAESDRHKAMKDFLARTAQAAGLEAHVEKTTRIRTSRPDVTIIGSGGVSLGCEAQYYNASAGTVLRRSKAHTDAGLAANWITHDDRFHLIDRSNWMLTRQVTWREISNAADLALVGGFRALVEWRCTASAERPCLDSRVKTGCGKVHLQWDTPRRLDDEGTGWTGHQGNTKGITVGQTLIGAATGSVTPLFIPSRKDRRAGAYMWVSADDRTRWSDHRSTETPDAHEDQIPGEEISFSGNDADTTCKFGEDTWFPGAPLERRGAQGVELTITVDDPAPARAAASIPGPRTSPGMNPPGAERTLGSLHVAHTFEELVQMQHAADEAHTAVEQLQDQYGPPTQTNWTVEQQASWDTAWRTWRDLADDVQAAVTEHAKEQGTPRHQVEANVKTAARHPELVAGG
jgi:hypothetical protein